MIRWIYKLYNYYLSEDKILARRMYELIGYIPFRLNLYRLAFYHKSNNASTIKNNERLEYLGDAILSAIVAEYLFLKYPSQDEGFLTKMRSKIVKRNSLDRIAEKMGLGDLLYHYNQTKISRSMHGNALEALVGSIYIELGYRQTRDLVIERILREYFDIHELENKDENYKSQLLEFCQKEGKNVSFKVISKYKLDKRDRFKVVVLLDGEKQATSDDFNKKSAEQAASKKTLEMLGVLDSKASPTQSIN